MAGGFHLKLEVHLIPVLKERQKPSQTKQLRRLSLESGSVPAGPEVFTALCNTVSTALSLYLTICRMNLIPNYSTYSVRFQVWLRSSFWSCPSLDAPLLLSWINDFFSTVQVLSRLCERVTFPHRSCNVCSREWTAFALAFALSVVFLPDSMLIKMPAVASCAVPLSSVYTHSSSGSAVRGTWPFSAPFWEEGVDRIGLKQALPLHRIRGVCDTLWHLRMSRLTISYPS